jgi:hypothetical protein
MSSKIRALSKYSVPGRFEWIMGGLTRRNLIWTVRDEASVDRRIKAFTVQLSALAF